DMNQPLGNYIGNWLEVYESVLVLKGEAKGDLYELCLNLAGAMIFLGKKASSIKEGIEISKEMINNGEAYKKFITMVKIQHGKTDVIENSSKYPKSKFYETISAQNGYLSSVDNLEIGMAALELGAGRMTKEDIIDHKAGIIFWKKIGDSTKKGEVLAELYSDSKDKLKSAKERILRAVEYSNKKVSSPKLIKKIIY
ncbi:MAG: thymidine phosphorylase, partial [Ignavibacteriaceae bacterium]|nr:thymidine phosphorylase [Ignavibacteriaceae bacterium]